MTIIIPVYNGAHVLPLTMEAVLGQPVDQIVYVDDGSTDDTFLLLDQLAVRDSRVQVVRHETNRSRAAARNTGVQEATSRLLLFLDADVAPSAGYADAMRHAVAERGAIAAVGTLSVAEPDEDSPYHQYLAWHGRGAAQNGGGPVPWRHFLTAVAAVERSVLVEAGGFPESVDYGEDLALACQLARIAPDGLRLAPAARGDQYDVGTLETALSKLRQFAASIPAIAERCPNVLDVAGLSRLASDRWVDRLALRIARASAPAAAIRSVIGSMPRPLRPLAVRYLLGHTLAVSTHHAFPAQRS